jgi:hypothetical protein
MIGRNKRPVHGVAGMYLMILFLDSRKIARVHVSYRAFSRVWAFHPYRAKEAKERAERKGKQRRGGKS